MSFEIQVQDSEGNILDRFLDETNVLAFPPNFDFSNYYLLGYVDPYGKTVVNHLQLEHFVDDLLLLRDSEAIRLDNADVSFVDAMLTALIKCKEDGLYLVLWGD